ncbi:hypothetical protein PTI97_11220 [Exiguobacterium marinum]|uniref:Uncharacterized protein n=1 Tax=Exiguobacterium marinum TaxID=273528 RepID=A0ABY7WWX8_9BACL|nr:hypothetical protein [Exiguobacterium marinum]WDH75387.1 hypothetical protein PTI97_11220 [Exiguobacterium marinum]
MAIVERAELYFELFSRKYEEEEDDPFIFSTLALSVESRGSFHFYGALLMKSEYEYLISQITLMLDGELNKFILNPVEPIFRMTIEREEVILYRFMLRFQTGKPRELIFYMNDCEINRFKEELKEEMTQILPPPFLP